MLRNIARKVVPRSVRKGIKASLEGHPQSSPQSYDAVHSFTIVSAVYNTEAYLNDYFESIFDQTCRADQVKLIMVDDGSTDGSREVIESWQSRYPGKITYIYQENAGPGAARNRGLREVETEWVTFIDSDDVISPDYLEQADRTISSHPALVLATCRWVYWWMADGRIQDNNLMAQHFTDKDEYFAVGDENMHPIFSASTTFFKTSVIRESGLEFDSQLKPVFEDAKFIAKLLMVTNSGVVGFLNKPRYFYRQRCDKTSLIGKSWGDPRRFNFVCERGYLELLDFSKRVKGHVPANIQQTVLQDISWYFKRLDNHPERNAAIGSENEQERFVQDLRAILGEISVDELFRIDGNFIPFYVKKGIAEVLMGADIPFLLCKLTRVDDNGSSLVLETYSEDIEFFFDGAPAAPKSTQATPIEFCGLPLSQRIEMRLAMPKDAQVFSYRLPGGKLVRLDVAGKTYPRSITPSALLDRLKKAGAQ